MNPPILQSYNRRWYDQIDHMTLAMLLSQNLPPEVQILIAKNLNDAIDGYRRAAKHNTKQAITVGQMKVLGIYKASKRIRWYDPDQRLSRAFNFMGTLPDIYLSEFAIRILQVAHYTLSRQDSVIYQPNQPDLTKTVVSILDDASINSVSLVEGLDGFRLVEPSLEQLENSKANTRILPGNLLRERA